MAREVRDSLMVGGSAAGDRPRPSDEALAVWQVGDPSQRIPACSRLLRVLVADDNRDAADVLSILVKLWGHDARQAYDGAAALQMAAAYQPDVLLLDIAMPKMDGFQLAQRLRRQARFQDTLLIAITGYAEEAHRLLGEEAGFDLYLSKPVEPSTLEILLLLEHVG
jgi:CheY-like chemotaxis protein